LGTGLRNFMIVSFDLAWIWPLLVSPFVGSFLGVLILRLPAGTPIAFARSACPHCHTRLGVLDLVPLASFLFLRGRCRYCRSLIGMFHIAVELAALAVALWALMADTQIWPTCLVGWTLLALAWIDLTEFLLPDVLTLPLLIAGLLWTEIINPNALLDHCIATTVGYLAFAGIAWAYRHLRGRDGLGGGDAKLIAAAGAWCGLAVLPLIILGSAVIGLLAALGLALMGRTVTSTTRIPFGPCIALAFWLIWLHGSDSINLIGVSP
jgi:leader peptidase (prepilin peptidase) / N-methyltransferase